MIAEILHKVAGMEKEERQAYRPRPSNAGPERCIRQMVYHSRQVPEDKEIGDRFVMVLDDSSFQEAITEDWINKSGFTLHSNQMGVDILKLPFIDEPTIPEPEVFELEKMTDEYHTVCYAGGWVYCYGCREFHPINTLHGHIDGIITDLLQTDTHYEHKALNGFTFDRYWEKETPRDYITQCILYQIGLRKLVPEIKQSILLIRSKNTSAYIDYLLEYDEPTDTARVLEICHSNGKVRRPKEGEKSLLEIPGIIAGIIERFEVVHRHTVEGTLPDRPFAMDNWHCSYCSWGPLGSNIGTCWQGYEQEFKDLINDAEFSGKITEEILSDVPNKVDAPKKYGEIIQQTIGTLAGMPIEEVCRRHLELANELAQTDAEYETFKATIKAYLRASGASAGRAGKYTIENKLMKRSYLNKEKIPENILMMATESRISEMLQIREPKQKK